MLHCFRFILKHKLSLFGVTQQNSLLALQALSLRPLDEDIGNSSSSEPSSNQILIGKDCALVSKSSTVLSKEYRAGCFPFVESPSEILPTKGVTDNTGPLGRVQIPEIRT